MKSWNKGHCTFFWDKWFGVDISECCKNHDSNCATGLFFNCLRDKFGGKFHATYIGFGGSVGCWIKYTKYMINTVKIKYNIKNKKV